jgi:hypothetical protein
MAAKKKTTVKKAVKKKKQEDRVFLLVNEKGDDLGGTFTGRRPRVAALKAVNVVGEKDGKEVTVRLRERGVRLASGGWSIHVFKGRRVKVRCAPWGEWQKAKAGPDGMIEVTDAKAHKVGVEHLVR